MVLRVPGYVFRVSRCGVIMIQERKLCCRRWIVKPNDRSKFEILLPLQKHLNGLNEWSEIIFPLLVIPAQNLPSCRRGRESRKHRMPDLDARLRGHDKKKTRLLI